MARLIFVVVDNLVDGWWLVAASKGCRAWNNKSKRWQTERQKRRKKVIHSFSVRSLARNTMISEMMIGFKFKELYVWEYDMLINSALNNKQQTTNDISKNGYNLKLLSHGNNIISHKVYFMYILFYISMSIDSTVDIRTSARSLRVQNPRLSRFFCLHIVFFFYIYSVN